MIDNLGRQATGMAEPGSNLKRDLLVFERDALRFVCASTSSSGLFARRNSNIKLVGAGECRSSIRRKTLFVFARSTSWQQ